MVGTVKSMPTRRFSHKNNDARLLISMHDENVPTKSNQSAIDKIRFTRSPRDRAGWLSSVLILTHP